MADASLYDSDFIAWTEQQARLAMTSLHAAYSEQQVVGDWLPDARIA